MLKLFLAYSFKLYDWENDFNSWTCMPYLALHGKYKQWKNCLPLVKLNKVIFVQFIRNDIIYHNFYSQFSFYLPILLNILSGGACEILRISQGMLLYGEGNVSRELSCMVVYSNYFYIIKFCSHFLRFTPRFSENCEY